MNLAMPRMLGGVLGGNIQNLKHEDRLPYCNLNEQPKAFNQAVGPPDWCLCCVRARALPHALLPCLGGRIGSCGCCAHAPCTPPTHDRGRGNTGHFVQALARH